MPPARAARSIALAALACGALLAGAAPAYAQGSNDLSEQRPTPRECVGLMGADWGFNGWYTVCTYDSGSKDACAGHYDDWPDRVIFERCVTGVGENYENAIGTVNDTTPSDVCAPGVLGGPPICVTGSD